MLTTKKTTNITGESKIDGAVAERYTAIIDSESPEDMTINSVKVNKTLAKDNRDTCRTDRAEFEDIAYALQDEVIANMTE